jgi:CHAT domain-containing protein
MPRRPAAADLDALVEQLARLPDRLRVRRLVRARRTLLDAAAVTRLSDEVAVRVHVDLDQAERLAEAARAASDLLDDDFCRARALRAEGHVLFSRGGNAAAVTRYDAALRVLRSLRRRVEVARTLSSSVLPLIYLGRYADAEARAEEARRIFTRAGDRLRLARLDSNLGNIRLRQDHFVEALALYRRAHAAFLELGQAHDVAVALHNMAVCYICLNQFEDALRSHREARDFCEAHGLPLLVVEADYNVAYLYYLRGEYNRAIELYQAARRRSEALGDAYHRALCDLDQSELYLELNLIEEGVELAHEAFAGFDRLSMGYEAAKALTNLAIGAGRRGETFRALELLVRARAMFEREANPVWPSLIDTYRALLLHHEGRHFEARSLAEAALVVFEGAGLPSKAALCELLLARVHLAVGEFRSAHDRCSAAIGRLRDAEAPDLSYRAHFLLGQAEEALGRRDAARESFLAAHARVENVRSHLEQDELKIGFLKDKVAVYESLVHMELSERTPAAQEAAFSYMEQAKSRSLADLMAFRAHALPSRSASPSGLVSEVHDLRQELNWYYRKIDLAELRREAMPAAEVESLRQESRAREARLLRTLRDLSGRDREFTSLQEGGAIGVDEIRSTLPPDGALVEYYETRGVIVAAVLRRDALEIVPLTPASRARHLLRMLQFQLSKFRLGKEYAATFAAELLDAVRAHLGELHAELLAPLRPLLLARRLVIVPHDFLHYVPFHALFDGQRYLVDDFAVSYAPSASVHHLCASKPARPSEGALVLGVPDPATPFIQEEVEAVAATLPGARLLLGEEATEEALRRHGGRSRIVHVATHGLFRYDNPMFSSLQLGGSRLSLFDLYQLDLSAELVTLSGCATGLNVVEGGDELMGLVRGLLYAGARAALLTLWDVNDQSTADFMGRFYRRLASVPDKALALQQTMCEMRERYPHPYYWAPFVLVGGETRSFAAPSIS